MRGILQQLARSVDKPADPPPESTQSMLSNQTTVDGPTAQEQALQRSTDTIQQTTKWTTTAFAAVGAALIVGLQVGQLGQFELTSGRALLAILGLLIALSAVARIIVAAAKVLAPPYVTFNQVQLERIAATEAAVLAAARKQDQEIWTKIRRAWKRLVRRLKNQPADRDDQNEDAFPLPSWLYSDLVDATERALPSLVHGTATDLQDLQRKQSQANEAMENALNGGIKGEQTSGEALQLLRERSNRLNHAADLVLAFANDFIVRREFAKLPGTCVRWGSVIALGTIVMAWALNPPEDSALAQGPMAVDIVLWESTKRELAASLGTTCVSQPTIRAVIIGGDFHEPEVAISSAGGCIPRRLTITQDRGVAVPLVEAPTTITQSPSSP
jgi:hypothetical protein